MKRWVKYLAFLALLVPFFFSGSQAQAAETDSVNFILHKIVFPNGEMPDDFQNTGDRTGEHESLLQDYRGLNDVTFDVYDVSQHFYELRAKGESVEAAQDVLSSLAEEDLGQSVASDTTKTANGEDGTASFTLPTKTAEGKDAVYLFHESKKPDNILEKAHDMVVVLPAYSTDNQILSTIHLYPKNEEEIHGEPKFNKTIEGKQDSYEFGDIIPFAVTVDIPEDILDYKKFVIEDTSDPSLVYQKGSLKVTESNQEIGDIYEKTLDTNGFKLNFTDIKALGAYAGKTLTVHYEMMLVATDSDTDIFVNEATLDTDHEVIHREVDVETGGRHFIKVDLENSETTLAGAEFRIQDPANKKYLIHTTDGFTWSDNAKDEKLVVLTSDAKGHFEINGLAYGDYALEEIKAPTGYELSEELVPFTVTKDSYATGATAALKVVNLKTPETPSEPKTPATPNQPTTSKPSKPNPFAPIIKVFPKTGETTSRALIVIGAILIAVVAVVWWQNKKGKKSQLNEKE